MNIALWGYGKMGKAIEQMALKRDHTIGEIITKEKSKNIPWEKLKQCDIVIEFTKPEAGYRNVSSCLENGLSVVSGTTGWNDKIKMAEHIAIQNHCGLIVSSNFSIGVNLFFTLNSYLSKIIDSYKDYNVEIEEIHHTEKKDKPSGTAITTANILMEHLSNKELWKLDECKTKGSNIIPIHSKRQPNVVGTHTTSFNSDIDSLSISHRAHNRQGFCLGSILSAEFLADKTGVFSMKDVLGIHF